MAETPNLSLPYLEAGQAQKHVTLNESLRQLDALAQLAVAAVSDAPPAEPEEGERHIVGASPAGAFAGHDNHIAAFQDGAWAFLAPRPGWRAWNMDAEELLVWSGSEWAALSAGGDSGEGDVAGPDGGVADGEVALFDGTTGKAVKSGRGTISHLGVGAPFDETDTDTSNRLVVKASRALFYAREDAETPGTGDIKLQISKEAEGNSASFFFSTNFSGRAEFGLVESDSFALKVSPDGAEWIEALSFDPVTGAATFREIAGVRRQLAADLTLHVDAASGSDANDGLAAGAGAFATIQKAVDTAAGLDLGICNVTINVAGGTYAPVKLKSLTGAGRVSLVGDTATPSNVTVSSGSAGVHCFDGGDIFGVYHLTGFRVVSSAGPAHGIYSKGAGSKIYFRYFDFGALDTSGRHMLAEFGGYIGRLWGVAEHAYTVSGGAQRHAHVFNGTMDIAAGVVEIVANIAFGSSGGQAFASAQAMGAIIVNANTWNLNGNTVTGRRYDVGENSFIRTNGGGANYFPGNAAGTDNSGAGLYS